VSQNSSQDNTENFANDLQEAEVYIVDDMEQVQDVIHLILENEGIKAKKFNSGEEFLAQKKISEIGCLILDNQMPGMSGLDVQAELLSRDIKLTIIFISGDSRYNEVADAVRDGAFYFLQKPFARSDLLARVREAIATSSNLSTKLLQSKKNREMLETLTGRERQVYQLVTDGLTNKAISESLGISNGTVEFHRANMMKKLDARSLADLMEINRSLDLK
jgi:FixJ family two-component response regulator